MANHITTVYKEFNKDEKATMGQIINVDDKELLIQVSPEENEPEWIGVNDFLGEVFGNQLEKKDFVDEALRIYHNKKNNPLYNIIKIMSENNK